MKNFILTFIALIVFGSFVLAQQNDSVPQNPYSKSKSSQSEIGQRLYFGGNFIFTLGSYTSIGIWPMVGYKVTPKLSVGLQPGYEYIKYNNYYGSDYETSNYGARLFTRYRVIPSAYVHVEFAEINYNLRFQDVPGGQVYEERTWVPFLFMGAGLSQQVGGSTYAYVQVLYDVLQDENSPYSNNELFWSVGIVAGF
jgi:hypothetical protein